MKKVSKIKSVEFVQSWESKEGTTFYDHRYHMEDGTQINANHKQMNPFSSGQEVEYEVKGNDPKGNPKGSVGKVSQQFTGATPQVSNYGNSDAILYQVCLKGVCDIATAKNWNDVTAEFINTQAMEMAVIAKQNIEILKTK